MGETKKIVVEHYPVDKLPEELRRGLASGDMVRVTMEAAGQPARLPLSSYYGTAAGCYTETDAVDYIRKLRDES